MAGQPDIVDEDEDARGTNWFTKHKIGLLMKKNGIVKRGGDLGCEITDALLLLLLASLLVVRMVWE